LAFEQTGTEEDGTTYLLRRPEMRADFSPAAASIFLSVKDQAPARLVMSFAGRTARITGEQELPGKTNYLHGNDPALWRTGIATYSRIRYAQLWPGVDLVFYGSGERLEHDFVVAPGADPKRIAFELNGAQRLSLTREGDLLVQIAGSSITFKKPLAYETKGSARKQIAAGYRVAGNKVTFALGRYDKRRTLTIDPVLVFSTLLAGSTAESISGMAVDAQGNIYLTGQTSSADFPTASPEQPACGGCTTGFDAFVTKLNPTGTALVYSTFLGGSDVDFGWSVGVDSSGNAIVAGITKSTDFPALHPIGTLAGTDTFNLFISSLSPTGASFNYSGVVGPLMQSVQFGQVAPALSLFVPLTVDASGNAYLTAQTLFSTFPTTPSAIAPVPANPLTAVLVAMKVSPAGALVYSTAIPGRATPAAGSQSNPGPNTFFPNTIAVDSAGSAYTAGQANDGLPTTLGVIGGAFVSDSGQEVFFPQEGFLLKLNPAGSALTYATYVPGTSLVSTMRLDSSGNAILAGITSSPALAISPNAFKSAPGCAGCEAEYLLKVNAQATATLGGTYLHGEPPLSGGRADLHHIAIDSNSNILVSGSDIGTFPPITPLVQTSTGNYVIQVRSDFSGLLFSSGGPDALIEIAPSGKIILAGNDGYPTTLGSFEPTLPPGRGNLSTVPTIAAIDLTVAAPAVCDGPLFLNFGSGVVAPGTTSAPQSSTVTNCGNADLHISSVASDSPDYAVTTNCALSPVGIAPGSSCTVTATYSPVDYKSGNIVIQDDALASPHKVGLSGFPNAPFTFIEPTPPFSFAETPVTTFSGLGVEIGNTGSVNLTVLGMSTTGDFTVSQNCVGAVLGPPTPNPPFGVQLHFCGFTVNFVPTNTGTRTGTLIIKDTSLDSPHIFQLSGLGLGAWPTPAVVSGSALNVTGTAGGVNASAGSTRILPLTGGGFSRVTTATIDGLIFDNNSRLIKVVSPQELDLTLTDNDFGDVGEVPVTATSPAPGGGTSSNVTTISAPVKFYDPLFRQISFLGDLNLVVGPKSGLIYDALGTFWVRVSLPNLNLATIAVVDPQSQRLTNAMVSFPHSAQTLGISDDEQFLYAAFTDNNTVAQISLPGGNINFMASLGLDPALGNYNATSIRVMPGHPHTWVAALQPLFDTKPIALKVFDDGVPRATTVENGNASGIFPGKLLFVGNDTSTVYSIDSTSLYRFTIDANGITLKDKTAGLGAEDFDTDGSLLYLSTGAIIDPITLVNKGNFALAPGLPVHAVVVDGGTSRAIFAGDGPAIPSYTVVPPTLVQGFDTKTLASKGSFNMPVSGGAPLLRWGTNGLALGLTLTRSSLTGNSGLLAPFHIGANGGQAPIGTTQISAGASATFNIGIAGVNGFNGPVTLSCANLPQFASCSFSQNPLTPGGSVVVTISTHQAATANATPVPSNMRSGSGFIALTVLLSLPIALAFARGGHRRKLLCVCLLIGMIGCGGGGGGQVVGPPPPTPSPTPTTAGSNTPIGTYDIILTGTSSAGTRHAVLQVIVL
jgi:hypothetical protein